MPLWETENERLRKECPILRKNTKDLLRQHYPLKQSEFEDNVIKLPMQSIPIVISVVENIKKMFETRNENKETLKTMESVLNFFKIIDEDQQASFALSKLAIVKRYDKSLLNNIKELLGSFEKLNIDSETVEYFKELETWLYGLFYYTYHLYLNKYKDDKQKNLDVHENYETCKHKNLNIENLILKKYCEITSKEYKNCDDIVFDLIDTEDDGLYDYTGKKVINKITDPISKKTTEVMSKKLTKLGISLNYFRAAQLISNKINIYLEQIKKAELKQEEKVETKLTVELKPQPTAEPKPVGEVKPLSMELNPVVQSKPIVESKQPQPTEPKPLIESKPIIAPKLQPIAESKPVIQGKPVVDLKQSQPRIIAKENNYNKKINVHSDPNVKSQKNYKDKPKISTTSLFSNESSEMGSANNNKELYKQEIDDAFRDACEVDAPFNVVCLSSILKNYHLLPSQVKPISEVGNYFIGLFDRYQKMSWFAWLMPHGFKVALYPNTHHQLAEDAKESIKKLLKYGNEEEMIENITSILKIVIEVRDRVAGLSSYKLKSILDEGLTNVINKLGHKNNQRFMVGSYAITPNKLNYFSYWFKNDSQQTPASESFLNKKQSF